MKYLPIVAVVALAIAFPASAGTVTEPAMNPDVVAQAATDSTTDQIDGLMTTLAYVLLLLVVAGAF